MDFTAHPLTLRNNHPPATSLMSGINCTCDRPVGGVLITRDGTKGADIKLRRMSKVGNNDIRHSKRRIGLKRLRIHTGP